MASEPKLVVQVEARVNQLERQMAKAQDQVKKATQGISTNSRRMGQQLAANNNRIAQSFRNTASSVALVHGPLGGIASRFSAFATLASSAGIAIGTASAALAGFSFAASKALSAFQKFETQQLVTQQVVRATGGTAGRTAEQIEQLAQSVAGATLASLDEARSAATQLMTFRSISGEVFDRTLRAAQDLATVGFGTLSSSAVQLGKALEDPTNGLSALRRVGVSFSEQQRQVIQDLVDTGRTAEAQTKILEILEKQVGGAGAASASGLAGAYDTLSQATQILLERWGSQIAQALNLQGAILGIANAIDAVNQRAGLQGQLAAADARVRMLQNPQNVQLPTGVRNPYGGDFSEAAREQALNEALKERQRLQLRIFREAEAQSMAAWRGIEAQKQLERERAEGVVAGLEKELSLAGKTNLERQIALKLAEAGVTAESELGQQIVKNLQAIDAAETALKESQRKGRTERKNELEREMESIEARIRLLIAETEAQAKVNPLVQDYGYAVEYAKTEQELLNAALKAGVEITPTLAGNIDRLASSYAAAVVESERLAEAQQKIKERAEELESLQKEVIGGFIRDMKNGVSAAEALERALSRVADKLLDDVLNAILKVNGAGGGGILGGLLGLFGGGGGFGGFGGGVWGGGLYDKGGYTGDGAKHEPAGVVHKGEYVFSKRAVDKIGAGNLEAMHSRLKGFASGGLVGGTVAKMAQSGGEQDVNINIRIDGARGNREIEEMVASGVSEGLRGYDKVRTKRFQNGAQFG